MKGDTMDKKNEETKDYSKLNIYQKMSIATTRIEKVIKGLTVGEGKNAYKAVSDKDVNNAVKPIENELGIYSYPFDRKITSEEREEFENRYGTTVNFVIKLETTYRFINTDKPEEFIDIKTYGYGIDSQDKAPGKAMTYADKYALLKAYKIETGDDPDKEKSETFTSVKKVPKEKSPYDFQREETMKNLENEKIQEGDKQYILQTCQENHFNLNYFLQRLGKDSIDDVSWAEALKIRNAIDKQIEKESKKKEEVF